MGKKKIKAVVKSQQMLSEGIYDMWIETELAKDAVPGQFIAVYPKNAATLLPRPISVCMTNEDKTSLRIVYRVCGKGTNEFSTYEQGEEIQILGMLGNGYDLSKADGKRVFLMGGGIGIPPMLETAKCLKERGKAQSITAIMGYRNNDKFLYEEFKKYADVFVATEDGSFGSKGNVMNAIAENALEADLIMSCGPMPMLRAIKNYAEEKNMTAYISLEERMACGVGACLGCVCKTKEVDHHSHVHNARICTDGPVFDAKEVEI